MARSDLTIQQLIVAGYEPTYAAANVDGNMWANSGKEFLHIINGSGSPIVATLITPAQTRSGLDIEDPTVTIAATSERMVAPLTTGEYNQPSGADRGKVYIDYDDVTTLTIGVFRP